MTETRDHIAEAREILGRLRPDSGIGPGTVMYGNLTQKAIGLTLLAIAGTLDEILSRIEPAAVPGLPKGYAITTRQTGNGNCKWRYELTGPRMAYSSRYRYDTSETALAAGIRHAKNDASVPAGLSPLLEAAREAQALNEPVPVTDITPRNSEARRAAYKNGT